MIRSAVLVLTPLALAGCLAAQLQRPAEDHAIQARIVADRYTADPAGYEAGDLAFDLEQLARQAELLEAIVTGAPSEPPGPATAGQP